MKAFDKAWRVLKRDWAIRAGHNPEDMGPCPNCNKTLNWMDVEYGACMKCRHPLSPAANQLPDGTSRFDTNHPLYYDGEADKERMESGE